MIMERLLQSTIPAFTLNEVLLSMWIVSFCVGFYSILLSSMKMEHFVDQSVSDVTSIHQMRLLFALSKDFKIEEDILSFTYLGEEAYFEVIEDRIVLKEGYQVFFSHLEEAYFQEEEYCAYLYYRRKEKLQKANLGCF